MLTDHLWHIISNDINIQYCCLQVSKLVPNVILNCVWSKVIAV